MAKKSDKVTGKSSKKKQKDDKEKTPKKEEQQIKTENAKKSNFKLNKTYLAIIPVIIILILLVFYFVMSSSDVVDAQLIIESGTVEVKHLGSWNTATNGMDLFQSDSIRTGVNASASIILFKGSIIRLNESTEITLKEIISGEENKVSIQQDAGRTWNTIEKISGIDHYEVETPTTVASVRGTSFDVQVNDEGITIVSVIEGLVNVSRMENGTIYTVELGQNWSIIVSDDEIGDKLDGHGLIQEIELDEWIDENLLEDDIFVDEIKEKIYENIDPYIDDLKDIYGMTDVEIEILIEGYIKGEFSIPPETPDEYKELFDLS